MLTDDQLAQRIGPTLRAELADLPVPDLLPALRRRRARRRRLAASLTVLPVAAGALAVSVVLTTGSAQTVRLPPQPSAHSANAHAGTVITLDGYTLGLPAGFHVSKLGAGFQATGPGAARFTIFLEHRPRPLSSIPGTTVTVGSRYGRWTGGRDGGELLISLPAKHGADYLVTKATGSSVTEGLVVSFVSRINFGHMRAINVACPPNCG
jgi:hypothetical protein